MAFRQPEGIPAKVSAFISSIKLSQVIAFALKTVVCPFLSFSKPHLTFSKYAIDHSKVFSGLIHTNWRQDVFEQLKTALSEWEASLPEHRMSKPPVLRIISYPTLLQVMWSQQNETSPFNARAGTLQILYHTVQMLIYRPFMPSLYVHISPSEQYRPHQPTTLPPPYHAMDVCIEAARSCARIIRVLTQRGLSSLPALLHAAHLSAGTLLIEIWDLKTQDRTLRAQGAEDVKPPFAQRIEPLMADVDTFMRILEWAEPRWGFVSPFL